MANYPEIPTPNRNNVVPVARALKEGYEISRGNFSTGDIYQSYDDIEDGLSSPNHFNNVNVGEFGTVYFGDPTSTGAWRLKRIHRGGDGNTTTSPNGLAFQRFANNQWTTADLTVIDGLATGTATEQDTHFYCCAGQAGYGTVDARSSGHHAYAYFWFTTDGVVTISTAAVSATNTVRTGVNANFLCLLSSSDYGVGVYNGNTTGMSVYLRMHSYHTT